MTGVQTCALPIFADDKDKIKEKLGKNIIKDIPVASGLYGTLKVNELNWWEQ